MKIVDGVLIKVEPSDIKAGRFRFPSGVKVIGKEAFCDTRPRQIVIPEGVSVIEEMAFKVCSLLERLFSRKA